MEVKLQVEGVKDLQRSMRALDDDLVKGLQRSTRKVSDMVADRVRPDVPVWTGALASSVEGTDDGPSIGDGRSRDYASIIYYRRGNRWFDREFEKLDDSGRLRDLYDAGIAGMLKASGLDVT